MVGHFGRMYYDWPVAGYCDIKLAKLKRLLVREPKILFINQLKHCCFASCIAFDHTLIIINSHVRASAVSVISSNNGCFIALQYIFVVMVTILTDIIQLGLYFGDYENLYGHGEEEPDNESVSTWGMAAIKLHPLPHSCNCLTFTHFKSA